ncbi:phospholipase D-like domain-containing protein [Altererythrobacter sp. Root672]|uniref:phospholipase D-like domain-containing protein n=1 Tax=Altererythrobacter sp. Root672 TaxID=1736584 RepID=UPI0009EB79F7|nr:phospholipase D-like domain-containing protein [Altererythrobacter sp. Root672]
MADRLDESVGSGEGVFSRAFDRITGSRLTAGNSIRLLLDAEQNYPAWLKAISTAQKRIHFENYIVADDSLGRLFADALIARAQAGVTVRLLHDWLGSFAWTSSAYWSRLRDAGVEVRRYNPPRLSMPFAWLHRDHRKVITIDGEIGFVSGLCIADIWLGDPKKGKAPWRDTGVAVEGPAVADIDRAFAESWGAAGGCITAAEARVRLASPGSAPIRVLGESPGRYQTYRVDQLIACVARRNLWLTDAYFVATPSFLRTLVDAADDGVDVRLLVPGSSDVPVAQALTRAHYRPLLEAGIRVFEWNGTMLHAKTAVYDGRWARVGSTNLNLTSWGANYELDLLIEDTEFARALEATFLADLRNSTEVVLTLGQVRPATARPPVRRQSGARALAASALSFGSQSGAVISGVRPLPATERRVALSLGLGLIAAAVVTVLVPILVILPATVGMVWTAAWMLLRAWRLSRGPRR